MMGKIILDSDGLIKLQKAGLLELLASRCDCIIPEAVYKESVVEGKKGLYEDAFLIEEIVHEKIDRIEIDKPTDEMEEIDKDKIRSLGEGEKEVFRLYVQEEADAVVSDDRAFLNMLDRSENIEYFTPCNVIQIMYRKEIITKKEALTCMDKIKELVRNDVHKKVTKKIKGGE